MNDIKNVDFICADADDAARQLKAKGLLPDVVVVDPPRKGLTPDVIGTIAALSPARVVYVSCDPATLARDLKIFETKGFKAVEATAFDMFPRCAHVETVVLMSGSTANSRESPLILRFSDTRANLHWAAKTLLGNLSKGNLGQKVLELSCHDRCHYVECRVRCWVVVAVR